MASSSPPSSPWSSSAPTRVETIAKQHGWRGAILQGSQPAGRLPVRLPAGITLASLGLAVGEPAFAELLEPLLAMIGVHSDELIRGISFLHRVLHHSYLHIVVGELAPKSWAIRKPELLSLWTAVPLVLFYWLMCPAIWLLNASANAISRSPARASPARTTSITTAATN